MSPKSCCRNVSTKISSSEISHSRNFSPVEKGKEQGIKITETWARICTLTKQIELRCILNIELLLDWLFIKGKTLGASHSNNVLAGFSTWNAPENHSCPTRGGIFNIASNDRYGPARSVFCYCWGLWTVVIWPKIVGNMCTWENTELWGEAAKKAGVLTWSSFRLNSEF